MFKKLKFTFKPRKKLKIVFPHLINNLSTDKNQFFEDGEWKIRQVCHSEFYSPTNCFLKGCGSLQEVSEYDLEINLNIFTYNCKYCGLLHSIDEARIPLEVQKRIAYRSELIKSGKIINLQKYKKSS